MRIRYSFSTVLILIASLGSECLAADNPLIGSWRWDNEKTLHEFKSPVKGSEELKESATKAGKFAQAFTKNLHSNMTLTYTDNECLEIVFDDKENVLSKESFPYKIIEAGKDFVILDQPNNGGVGKLFLEGNSFYVEVKVGEFRYRDYFTKS